jgi:two-component system, NarL family, sensor kinase
MANTMLLSHLLTASEAEQDRERARVSKILHDETGGQMMALATELELLRMDGVKGLEPALAALDRAFESVRMLSRDLHPQLVSRVGLSKALQALAASATKRYKSGFHAEIAEGVEGPAEMYRIAEELVDNAIRHSQAGTIYMVLKPTGELIVRDNGTGFDPRLRAKGLGLLRVRLWGERAHLRVRLRVGSESGTMFKVNESPCHLTSY